MDWHGKENKDFILPCLFFLLSLQKLNTIAMIEFKKKTREELVKGFKKAIARKREFEAQAQKEFEDMRARRIILQN